MRYYEQALSRDKDAAPRGDGSHRIEGIRQPIPAPSVSRRRAGIFAVTPFLGAVMAACAAPVPINTVQDPQVDLEIVKLLMRHVNVLLVGDLRAKQGARFIDIFWSQSCGDTMRAYDSKLKSMLVSPPKSTVFALHLIARSPADLGPCTAIRSVSQQYYGAAVQAVLEVGGKKKSFVSEAEVTQAIAAFPQGRDGFKPDFAQNCLKLSQEQALQNGIEATPFFLIDGKPGSLREI